jgi:hypothetical protein
VGETSLQLQNGSLSLAAFRLLLGNCVPQTPICTAVPLHQSVPDEGDDDVAAVPLPSLAQLCLMKLMMMRQLCLAMGPQPQQLPLACAFSLLVLSCCSM